MRSSASMNFGFRLTSPVGNPKCRTLGKINQMFLLVCVYIPDASSHKLHILSTFVLIVRIQISNIEGVELRHTGFEVVKI